MINLLLSIVLSSALYADDDMSTATSKKDSAAPTAEQSAPTPAKPAGPALDPALRAKIRAKAPFWIDDSSHGAPVRINKDGTFSSETQGGGSIAGQWKALKGGNIQISWSDGGEQYSYKVTTKGKKLLIDGESIKGNRYKLNN